VGEVDDVIGELRQLSAKLQADGERIKSDIQEYEILSQQVMQLPKIVPTAWRQSRKHRRPADLLFPRTGAKQPRVASGHRGAAELLHRARR